MKINKQTSIALLLLLEAGVTSTEVKCLALNRRGRERRKGETENKEEKKTNSDINIYRSIKFLSADTQRTADSFAEEEEKGNSASPVD